MNGLRIKLMKYVRTICWKLQNIAEINKEHLK